MTIRRMSAGLAALAVAVGLLVAAGTPVAATTVSVATEPEYRAALIALSADASEPHVINVTADITIDDGTDPVYDGTQPLAINGNGHILDAAGTSRILDHDTPALLTVNGVTMGNGFKDSPGGAIRAGGSVTISDSNFTGNVSNDGGAVNAYATGALVTVTGSRFENNGDPINSPFTEDGGAIRGSDVTVTDSTFTANSAENGGAIYGGAITVASSTFTGNTGTQGSAAINGNEVNVTGSTFADNNTGDRSSGGAVEGDQVTAVNSTFTGNTATERGGAIAAAESVRLTYATLASNSAPQGASVYIRDGALTTFGTVFADPLGGGDNCSTATTTSNGHNYSSDASCGLTGTGDTQDGADPQLDALGDFGGPTRTRPPAVASPLVDAIPVAACDPTVTTDQRALPRPSDGDDDGTDGCDIGAVELQATPPPTPPAPPAPGPVAARPAFTG